MMHVRAPNASSSRRQEPRTSYHSMTVRASSPLSWRLAGDNRYVDASQMLRLLQAPRPFVGL
jgi:hypothetical protein